jgi:HPt (histidine-containing phosphotransfer) domain-containing protein
MRSYIEKTSIRIISDDDVELTINITVSIGLVLAQNEILTIDELLKQADRALYYAKEHGRNQVVDASIITSSTFEEDDDIVVNLIKADKDNFLEEDQKMVNYDGIEFDVGVNNVLGDQELFKEILVMFYQDHHLDGEKLQSAIESKDIDSVKHLAHTLKGVACSVGAMDLFEVTKALDMAINENKQEDIDGLFSQLSPELNRVMKGISLQLDVS